jgi:hypothetical protein
VDPHLTCGYQTADIIDNTTSAVIGLVNGASCRPTGREPREGSHGWHGKSVATTLYETLILTRTRPCHAVAGRSSCGTGPVVPSPPYSLRLPMPTSVPGSFHRGA